MASPTVTASLNKPSYVPGEPMLLTVVYGDSDNAGLTITVIATDSQGNSSAPVSVQANISDPVTILVSDDGSRDWVLQSDSGSVAVYRAVA